MIPLVVCWEYFPNNKGMVSGILSGAYGMGSFFYTLISTNIVNSLGEKATVPSGVEGLNYFTEEIA